MSYRTVGSVGARELSVPWWTATACPRVVVAVAVKGHPCWCRLGAQIRAVPFVQTIFPCSSALCLCAGRCPPVRFIHQASR
jgi:hypothetical protein